MLTSQQIFKIAENQYPDLPEGASVSAVRQNLRERTIFQDGLIRAVTIIEKELRWKDVLEISKNPKHWLEFKKEYDELLMRGETADWRNRQFDLVNQGRIELREGMRMRLIEKLYPQMLMGLLETVKFNLTVSVQKRAIAMTIEAVDSMIQKLGESFNEVIFSTNKH